MNNKQILKTRSLHVTYFSVTVLNKYFNFYSSISLHINLQKLFAIVFFDFITSALALLFEKC